MTTKTSSPRTPKAAPTALASPQPAHDGANDVENSGSATLQAEAAPASPSPAPAPRATKAALLRAMLDAPGGASLAAIMAATGWQAHTVRAALSGQRKAGMTLAREKVDGETVYRIVPGVAEAALGETGTIITAPFGSHIGAAETETEARA